MLVNWFMIYLFWVFLGIGFFLLSNLCSVLGGIVLSRLGIVGNYWIILKKGE